MINCRGLLTFIQLLGAALDPRGLGALSKVRIYIRVYVGRVYAAPACYAGLWYMLCYSDPHIDCGFSS